MTIDDTTPVVGETLTADASSLDDPDGLTNRSFTWQWLRVSGGTETEITGATTASYTVVAADVGSTLKVRAGFTDDDNTIETVESAETTVVAPLLPEVTVASDGDVTEGSPAVFTLTRTGDPAQTLDVAWEVTATGDFGVTTGEGTATFPANSSTVQVSLTTTDDGAHEAHGSVTLTLTADTGADPAYLLGDPATATAAVRDDDLIEGRQRKLEYALALFGRTMVQDLVTAVEDRSGAAASGTTATLAGMPLVSLQSEEGVYEARYADPDGELSGTAAWRELLSRSSFQLSLGKESEGEADGTGAGALVLWGRGSQSWSAGRMDPAVTTRGEVLSGQLGLELRVRGDTSLGVMLSGSTGEVEFDATDGELDAKVETELVGVHPYAQWSPRRGLRMWTMLGYGVGEAALTDGFSTLTGADIETDIEMIMAAGGGSHEVASLWGVDWSVGTSGFFVQFDADEVRFDADEQVVLLPALESEVWQVRLLLEGSAGEDFVGVEGLRGNVELAARVDGGDAESGTGMELGGGVAYGRADLGLEVEASGRVLLSHEEEGLEEAGVSLGLEFDPGEPGRGVYFALAPSWGNAASGARAVWEGRRTTAGESGGRDRFDPEMRLSSELGYTTPVPTRRGTLTTYSAFSSDGGAARQYRVGRRLELGVLSMSLEAERYESAGAAPEHGIWLRGSIRF